MIVQIVPQRPSPPLKVACLSIPTTGVLCGQPIYIIIGHLLWLTYFKCGISYIYAIITILSQSESKGQSQSLTLCLLFLTSILLTTAVVVRFTNLENYPQSGAFNMFRLVYILHLVYCYSIVGYSQFDAGASVISLAVGFTAAMILEVYLIYLMASFYKRAQTGEIITKE